ncbi:MAG: helix-turn-helix transcriptional regulator [Bacteroidales bacterium]|nr:helix-turn-helix transcriptional regulator [Bacteroidales bacterium]
MEFNEIFKEIRTKRGLSQEFMAEKLGIDSSAVSNIEKGKRDVKVKELGIIAKAFEISVQDLIGYPNKYKIVGNQENEKNDNDNKVMLCIELTKDKKDQILKLAFGENVIEILNK